MRITKIENADDGAVLTQEAQTVSLPFSDSVKQFIADLKNTHDECGGVGLAATQVNKALKIFIIEISEEQASLRHDGQQAHPKTVYINPSYRSIESAGKSDDVEACFSVHDKAGWVPRFNEIEFTATKENGETISFHAKGFLARVLQHETDHVYGILITDHLTSDCRQGSIKEMYALRATEMNEKQKKILKQLKSTKQIEK